MNPAPSPGIAWVVMSGFKNFREIDNRRWELRPFDPADEQFEFVGVGMVDDTLCNIWRSLAVAGYVAQRKE